MKQGQHDPMKSGVIHGWKIGEIFENQPTKSLFEKSKSKSKS